MGTIEFGKMIVNSVVGNIVFWGIMIFFVRMICIIVRILG